jgi:hypothetical protein
MYFYYYKIYFVIYVLDVACNDFDLKIPVTILPLRIQKFYYVVLFLLT